MPSELASKLLNKVSDSHSLLSHDCTPENLFYAKPCAQLSICTGVKLDCSEIQRFCRVKGHGTVDTAFLQGEESCNAETVRFCMVMRPQSANVVQICRARTPGSAEILQMYIARRTGGAEILQKHRISELSSFIAAQLCNSAHLV